MTAWAITGACLLFLAIIWKRTKPAFLWWVKPLLAVIASASFTFTSWGQTVAGWMLGFLGWVGTWFGTSGSQVATVLLVAALVVMVLDIAVDRVANTAAIAALVMIPLLGLIAAGPVASTVRNATDNVAGAGQSGISRLVGGG